MIEFFRSISCLGVNRLHPGEADGYGGSILLHGAEELQAKLNRTISTSRDRRGVIFTVVVIISRIEIRFIQKFFKLFIATNLNLAARAQTFFQYMYRIFHSTIIIIII